jgi:hypothetical protein
MDQRVIFHVGPHKTGTTSIQQSLLESESVGYAKPEIYGPGHAHIAWRALGVNNFQPQINLLVDIANSLSAFDTVVFSSEEFSRVLESAATPVAIQQLCEKRNVELVVTLTPLADRLISEVQELIKHKYTLDLTNAVDMLGILKVRPGLNPNYLSRIVELAKWSRIHFVIVDKGNPDLLFDAFSRMVGVKLKRSQPIIQNPRLPYGQAALLSVLNTFFKKSDMMLLRKAAQIGFQRIGEVLPEIRSLPYPDLPFEIRSVLDMIWSEQLAYMSLLEAAGRAFMTLPSQDSLPS